MKRGLVVRVENKVKQRRASSASVQVCECVCVFCALLFGSC